MNLDFSRSLTLFLLSKDKVYKDTGAEILPKIKDILRTKPNVGGNYFILRKLQHFLFNDIISLFQSSNYHI